MTRINLLPHREAKRKARRQQFYVTLGLISVLAGLIWFLGYSILNGYISGQEAKNEFLKKEIAALDAEIAQIKKLKEEINEALQRKNVIEQLQANRTETVYLFNELARRVPDGIYFQSLVQTGNKIVIIGNAQTNARITTLMNNLDDSPLFERSELIVTQSKVVGPRRLNEFTINTYISKQTDTGKKDAPKQEKKP